MIDTDTEQPRNEPIGICEVCGAKFQQYYNPKTNVYSNYRKCPKHKKLRQKLNEEPIDSMDVFASYIPFPLQKKIHDSKARNKVICAGNRFGKSRLTIMECIRYYIACMNEERRYVKTLPNGKKVPNTDFVPRVLWWAIAPTEQDYDQFWSELKQYFPKQLVIDISESNHKILTLYGGVIEMRSAYNPEDLTQKGVDIVSFTEAAKAPKLEMAWNNLEARVNSDGRGYKGKGGKVMVESSPLGDGDKGGAYFQRMFEWGQGEDPDWESWRCSTFDNPAMEAKYSEVTTDKYGVSLTKKERLRRRIGDRMFNQQWLAMFTASGSKCFPKFRENCVISLPHGTKEEQDEFIREWETPNTYEQYIIAYDPASGAGDIPALAVFNHSGKMKKAYSLYGYDWPQQYKKIQEISKEYNNAPVAFSDTGHTTIESTLTERGITCLTFHEQGANKANFVIRLEGVVSSSEMQVLDDRTETTRMFIEQHCDYARVMHGKTVSFSNVNEPHDDFVSCSYIAFQAITTPSEVVPFVGYMAGVSMY